MVNRKEIKRAARNQLKNNIFSEDWLRALLVCLIVSLILSFLDFTIIGTILISGPLCYGLCLYFLDIAKKDKRGDLDTVFKGFDHFGGALLLFFMRGLFTFLWSLLFIIPGIIKHYSYSMAMFIKVEHDEYDYDECITRSRKMMKGHKWDLFVLDLSFIGWYIVGALVFGIGTLWVIPYHNAAYANFYLAIKDEKAPAQIEKEPEEEIKQEVVDPKED